MNCGQQNMQGVTYELSCAMDLLPMMCWHAGMHTVPCTLLNGMHEEGTLASVKCIMAEKYTHQCRSRSWR